MYDKLCYTRLEFHAMKREEVPMSSNITYIVCFGEQDGGSGGDGTGEEDE